MRLRKCYTIINDRDRKGIITEFGSKNGHRVISYHGVEGSFDGWCYREQIIEVYKPNGTRVYPIDV